MEQIKLKIISPEKTLVDMTVETVVVPGVQGDFGVLPGHTEFLTLLREGVLTYTENRRTYEAFITGGFAEVVGNRVTVLADHIKSETALS